ncbi:right-handed parallel beta-helix repeat-containing protein [Deminuibacter soli]|nr:right-handed parallel beta-helix repeat-containing protein [Deminuibacter soli]
MGLQAQKAKRVKQKSLQAQHMDGADSNRVIIVHSIEDMQQLADSSLAVLLTDTLRGGLFYYSADTTTDGGTAFRSVLPGAGSWKRQYEKTGGINVRWFGARGDGVTNDAPALQQAINKAAAQLTPVLVPDGTYFIPGYITLLLPSNTYLKGQDKESTRFVTDTVYTDAAPMMLKGKGNHIHIANIGFDGGRRGTRSTQHAGRYSIVNLNFDTEPANDILIEHCGFANVFGRALLYRASQVRINDCDFEHIGRYNIDFATVDGAISNFAREGCSDVSITNCRFRDIGTHCISSYKISGLTIADNKLEHISGIGMANQECEHVKVTGNGVYYSGDNGMDFQRCKQVLISDNYFLNAGDNNAGRIGSGAAIFFGDDYSTANASNTVISNNFIRGSFSYEHLGDTAATFQNCGMYIIDANHVKISDNNIQGIGEPRKNMQQPLSIEDGNGIMIINTAKGESHDILVQGNTLTNLKCNAIYINGQSREIKIKDNYINTFGLHGVYMCAVGTNLYSQIEGNTIIDGKNIFRRDVAADIFIKAENAWITNFSITNNQIRNNRRANYQSRNDTVFTTHGIYFTADGFGKFNNLIVSNNQIHGHMKDEIGFSDKISEYSILKDTYFPAVSFNNNYSGSTDDYPGVIIPGLNQARKPRIVTESFSEHEPDYGNYTAGSIIRNIYPGNSVYAWVATNSGFAATARWHSGAVYTDGQTVYYDADVFLCKKGGVSGREVPRASDKMINDGSVQWQYMGKKVYFKELHLR